MKTDRPILVTGPPRSGTTFLDAIGGGRHGYTRDVERNDLWDAALPVLALFARLRRIYPVLNLPPAGRTRKALLAALTAGLGKRRLLTKSPSHVARLGALRGLWPDARIVAIVRAGEDVAASLIEHGSAQRANPHLPLASAEGIGLLGRRFRRGMELLAAHADAVRFVRYERLVADPPDEAAAVLDHCGLAAGEYLAGLRARPPRPWQTRIPHELHEPLAAAMRPGNELAAQLAGEAPCPR